MADVPSYSSFLSKYKERVALSGKALVFGGENSSSSIRIIYLNFQLCIQDILASRILLTIFCILLFGHIHIIFTVRIPIFVKSVYFT